ncbi:uncharacterized protein [Prorops nasuta]|uniref:uncharacterized protein n=1 Tax=Prorops nasuta TaxID=863751 RepID=UPI0034CF6051
MKLGPNASFSHHRNNPRETEKPPPDYNSFLGRLKVIAIFLLLPPVPSSQWSLDSFNVWSNQVNQRSANYYLDPTRFSRVLNFFPVPVDEECLSEDKRRLGICMNTYECRIQHGKSHGPCALGFGVCCIFTVGCEEEVQNNSTYVISPGFPNLIESPINCSIKVRKIDKQVSQLRIDFDHFNIGQPNRRTGVCDGDLMEINNGKSSLELCGWNSGQHVYVDVDEGDDAVTLDFRLAGGLQSRMWEMRVVQLGFEDRAPAGCLQYFRSANGTLRTLNYLPNGRYLAGQDYLLCVRQEKGMCGISYEACTNESFRIGSERFFGDGPAGNTSMTLTSGSNGQGPVTGTNGGGSQADVGIEGSGAAPVDAQVASAASTPGNSVASGPETARACRDRVLIPCDFEEFITAGNSGGTGMCNLEHCGSSLCSPNELDSEGNCRVETWATPFRIRVAFGPGQDAGSSLDENTGMCLSYQQLPCVP